MDVDIQRLVDTEWAARFDFPTTTLQDGGVHVVLAEIGANDAMSFRFGDTCVVAVGHRDFEAARAAVAGLDSTRAFTAETLRKIVGSDARLEGPSKHGYVSERTFRGGVDAAVAPVDGGDPKLLAFLEDGSIADWAESGFPRDPVSANPEATRFWVLREGGRIVAAGNMTAWRGLPADVGLVTDSRFRGRGLATRLAGTMLADMLPTIGVARYRALAANLASLAVAHRLGFELYGQNYRARLSRR